VLAVAAQERVNRKRLVEIVGQFWATQEDEPTEDEPAEIDDDLIPTP